ncbi:hypothetical protein ACFST9_05050 [Hymenobacter monticola]|uniref:Uncharacterized protein n=1 Tax=Hymenobacter monticola TaxID=1705399 RepID=A0ABY4BA03_9BACT|nr:hypothetical protein [Hymenobacter monticola]UOE35988.1 hypothetical protein MTP16_10180 [Hymenobacter monticola]
MNIFPIVAAILSAAFVAVKPPLKVRAVRLHAYSLSSSIWIPVDTLSIQNSAPLKIKLKEPARFVAQLEQALAARDTIPMDGFKSSFVRFWFQISYQNGTIRSVYLAQGSSLLIGTRLYKLDNELKKLIREYLPEKDTYLPVSSRK